MLQGGWGGPWQCHVSPIDSQTRPPPAMHTARMHAPELALAVRVAKHVLPRQRHVQDPAFGLHGAGAHDHLVELWCFFLGGNHKVDQPIVRLHPSSFKATHAHINTRTHHHAAVPAGAAPSAAFLWCRGGVRERGRRLVDLACAEAADAGEPSPPVVPSLFVGEFFFMPSNV